MMFLLLHRGPHGHFNNLTTTLFDTFDDAANSVYEIVAETHRKGLLTPTHLSQLWHSAWQQVKKDQRQIWWYNLNILDYQIRGFIEDSKNGIDDTAAGTA